MKKILAAVTVILCLAAAGCANTGAKESAAVKKEKKALLVIAPKEFADDELFKPKAELEKNGIKTIVAGIEAKESVGMGGRKITPDIALKDVKAEEYDLIAVIGGYGTINFLWNNEELRDIVIKADNSKKYVAAICAAPVVLARAGLLDGKKATGYQDAGIVSEIEKNGGKYTGEVTQVDGRIITGKNPEASQAFGEKLVEILKQ
jgi:protease I